MGMMPIKRRRKRSRQIRFKMFESDGLKKSGLTVGKGEN